MPTPKIETLRPYVDESRPFGPTNAKDILDQDAANLLFDSENRIYQSFIANPTIIVGRRGSGKTAYLYSEYHAKRYSYVLECDTAQHFGKILREISTTLDGPFFPEEVADLWDTTFTIFFLEVLAQREKTTRLPLTRDYLAKFGFSKEYKIENLLWKTVDIMHKNFSDGKIGAILDAVKVISNVTLDEAKNEMIAALGKRNAKAVLLLDSLDGYQSSFEKVPHAITGLLKCLGGFNKENQPFHIRFCLPAELYHRFSELSSNPLKDFEKHVTLHWVSAELLSIAARRIQLYAELHHKDLFDTIKRLNPDKRDDARYVFFTIFPRETLNSLGFLEDTLAYILRHTQLLPRQFLRFLNAIMNKNKRLGGNYLSVKPEAVQQGVAETEETITKEIFSAFKPIYPSTQNVCLRCIPELPLTFSYGELQEVFTKFGKKAMGGDDYFDFRKMLIEIGAIGKIIEEKERYYIGEFEYNVPHRLVVSTDDEFCLHPLFASMFSFKRPKNRNMSRTIYPYGTDIETEDRREFPK